MNVDRSAGDVELHAEEILKLEFEYARETAAQAQNDRTVIVNLYLILVGGVGSILLAIPALGPERTLDLPLPVFSLLFFLLAIIGFLTLFKLIRLRQAWYDSVTEMNSIKDYYLKTFPQLESAFRWRTQTIPGLGKPWTITFILSLLVVLIDSVALGGAVHLLHIRNGLAGVLIDVIVAAFGFVAQALFFFSQLSDREMAMPQ